MASYRDEGELRPSATVNCLTATATPLPGLRPKGYWLGLRPSITPVLFGAGSVRWPAVSIHTGLGRGWVWLVAAGSPPRLLGSRAWLGLVGGCGFVVSGSLGSRAWLWSWVRCVQVTRFRAWLGPVGGRRFVASGSLGSCPWSSSSVAGGFGCWPVPGHRRRRVVFSPCFHTNLFRTCHLSRLARSWPRSTRVCPGRALFGDWRFVSPPNASGSLAGCSVAAARVGSFLALAGGLDPCRSCSVAGASSRR